MPEVTTSTGTDDASTTATTGTETGTATGTETDPAEALEALRALSDELGLTPEQLKGRLDASRKWEKRAKDNAAAATRLAALEQANKGNQSADEQLAEARRSAATAALQLKRYEVAADMKLPASVAGLLAGDDDESMRAAAEDLIAFAKTYGKTAAPDLKQGNRGTRTDTTQTDPDAWFRDMARGRR